MITFKKFFESNKPLGLIETITFKELGPVEAKIDSGNGAYNVLHGINIQDNREQVTFETVNNIKYAIANELNISENDVDVSCDGLWSG